METEENKFNIYSMKLHERFHLKESRDLNIFVMRVHDGWIYEYSKWNGYGYDIKKTQFVPKV